jgi:uncharacterized protein
MDNAALQARETEHGLEILLHVQPRARRPEISGVFNGALKVKITAPPVDDAANRALIEYLASRLGVSKTKISILSGARSRDKKLLIKNISLQELHKKLEI